MIKEELIRRSPLRILEKSLHGGLGRGNIGVLASRKGVGKTACLVHIATDKLFQGKPVIHVSYSSRVDSIINWYEEIFAEIARKRKLVSSADLHEEIVRKRVIMNFKQVGTKTDLVLRSLEAMIVHGKFEAETVIIDGYDFTLAVPEDMAQFKDFAGRMGLEVWFSASLRGEEPIFNDGGVPLILHCCMETVDVLITLRFKDDYVRLNLVKDRQFQPAGELQLRLDPKTLLIAEDA